MEYDLSAYVRKCFQEQYKKKGENFSHLTEDCSDNKPNEYTQNLKKQRATELKNQRKEQRDNVISQRRKIKENQTPFITPEVKTRKMDTKYNEKTRERLDRLVKWRAQKELVKKLDEKKRKPLFKVYGIQKEIGLPKLDNVNYEIKGKLFKPTFVPENFKFKPPANVQAININETSTNRGLSTSSRVCEPKKTAPLEHKSRMVTRSQAKSLAETDNKENNKNTANSNLRPKNKVRKTVRASDVDTEPRLNNKKPSKNGLVRVKVGESKPVEQDKYKDNRIVTIKSATEKKQQTPKKSNKKIVFKESKKVDKNLLETDNNIQTGTKPKKATPHPTRRAKFNKTEKNNNSPDLEAPPSTSSVKTPTKLRKSAQIKIVVSEHDDQSGTETKTSNLNSQTPESRISDSEYQTANTESSGSTDYSLNPVVNSSLSDSSSNCKSNEDVMPVYISPFVTVSRGKDRARKEYENRQKGDLSNSINSNLSSPKAGAAYFTKLLNREIARIQDLCENWTKYKEKENPIEEACSMIDVAIGQSQLLINKKCEQFRNLIEKCETSDDNEGETVTCTDLHGFWDLIYIQIENVKKRFENLDNLKSNNWQEFFPVVKKTLIIKKTSKKTLKKNNNASSVLKNAIKAAKLKQKSANVSDENTITFNGGFFSVNSPEKKTSARKSNSVRKSLLSNLSNSTNKRDSSPGLTMMKVSNLIKAIGSATPGKSILKKSNSIASVSKSVLFENDLTSEEGEIKPKKTNNDLLSPGEPVLTPARRSTRFIKSRLFD